MMLFSFMGGVSFGGRLRARGSGCRHPKATPPSLRLHTFRAYLLLALGRRLGHSPAPAGPPGESPLAQVARWHCPATESHPRDALPGLPASLLLVGVSELRVRHGPRVPRRGAVATALPPAAPPRHHDLRQR